MRVAVVSVAYNEERFIGKHLKNNMPWVDECLVLVSRTPWHGEAGPQDDTVKIAKSMGASVIHYDWATEHEQRNAGQEYLADYDWIIVLDPDEFLTRSAWGHLLTFLETAKSDAFTCRVQHTYWKSGFVIDPPEDFKQIIAVKPGIRFYDKRCVESSFGTAPATLHHMSWARTDAEILSKISHYGHAHEINKDWYENVWQKWTPEMENLHPMSPEALKRAIPAELPQELERLDLWPK